jgi:hypothetical protein
MYADLSAYIKPVPTQAHTHTPPTHTPAHVATGLMYLGFPQSVMTNIKSTSR